MAAAAVRGIGGGLGLRMRELRIHLCQRSAGSQGVREFIEKHYVTLKKANPDFPILIRECSGVQPKLWARYEFGKEKSIPLNNLTVDEVAKALESAVKSQA
ncbi:NADH dehydrogenase [ubiquinone] 1 alpha subcomplex subunit 2 [Chiroxiphia lanceolata]|uniref:NADH dehydrogenase [ubiquinone] 1 alpha subcomplex subunit 2 n=1 Tax=Pipra filicauda TaxID=649802 RepID=A0A6J2HZ85_9PASS|nr:NADH dehydrogenase [ubiquinone] 1 alpha subcomplex subunit 2 [Pipra filicauda]XP_032559150.1 NADH dehydrogenase [ubiquinone] 1 alpha subcomplex subunit 2 [Chiroxiphia lanceolata]XP_051649719.1 NADH dehydrogenase [ubiquinone] 1 alpha subcomplex subunit 2 [Manacus candei]